VWKIIAKLAVKLAVFALKNPEKVKAVVDAVKREKQP
jgi:hypothetical protein